MKQIILWIIIFFWFTSNSFAESYYFNIPIYNDIIKYNDYNPNLTWQEKIKWNDVNAMNFCFSLKWKLVSYNYTYDNVSDVVLYKSNLWLWKITTSNNVITDIICDIDIYKTVEKNNFMSIEELEQVYELELMFLLLLTIIVLLIKITNPNFKINIKK